MLSAARDTTVRNVYLWRFILGRLCCYGTGRVGVTNGSCFVGCVVHAWRGIADAASNLGILVPAVISN